jgi:hypothetical protein
MIQNLVYFASGEYKKEYEDLPAQKVYLVDYIFENSNLNSNIKVKSDKVALIGMGALESIDYFMEKGIKIDCAICINECKRRDGGIYYINKDGFWGYAMKVMSDQFYHIWDPSFYGSVYPLILPYKREEVNRDILGDFNYKNLSVDRHDRIKANKLTKRNLKQSNLNLPAIRLFLKNDSIWKEGESLDGIFISCNKDKQLYLPDIENRKSLMNFFGSNKKVIFLEEKISLEEIFNICNEKKIKKAGITPWLFGEYEEAINTLENYSGLYPKEVNFYHLNPEDFSIIYKWLAKKKSTNLLNDV